MSTVNKYPVIQQIIDKMSNDELTFLGNVLNTKTYKTSTAFSNLPETHEICMAVIQNPNYEPKTGILWNTRDSASQRINDDFYLIDLFTEGEYTKIYHIVNDKFSRIREVITLLEVRYWLTLKTGGGGGGTTDYNALTNKPQINGVELSGNKSTSELKIIQELELTGTSGTLTAEELAKLQSNRNNKIILKLGNNEYEEFYQEDDKVANGYIAYIHTEKESSAFKVKAITITISTRAWVLVEQAVPTKTSELTNDSGFIDNTYHDATKLDASKSTLQDTAPTSAITDGGIHIVHLASSTGVTEYNGYIYMYDED